MKSSESGLRGITKDSDGQRLHWLVSPITKKLAIAAINFVNPAPLMWDFEHEPRRSELATRYRVLSSTPAECARRLEAGVADIGLVPVAAYEALPDAAIVPRCAIASLDHVRSILLVLKHDDDIGRVTRVALDTDSLTSATYTRILFSKLWKRTPEFVAHSPDLNAMMDTADAAMLIGDPALLALEKKHKDWAYLDLAHEWRAWTGTPWVSAFWAVREPSFGPETVTRTQLVEDFERSRDAGLAHVSDLVREWSAKIPVPAAVLKAYMTKNIHYFLDDACLEGLRLFYRYAVECGALRTVPKLRFL
jgi:chorismate dehydratase